jgi:Flp pilus assembly protein TadB
MLSNAKKGDALQRAISLIESDPRWTREERVAEVKEEVESTPSQPLRRSKLKQLLIYADVNVPPFLIIIATALIGLGAGVGASIIVPTSFVPLYALLFSTIPYSWLNQRASARAATFAEDYPGILLATASSIKAGLTPVGSLESAVDLLPSKSMAKREVQELIKRLEDGEHKEEAIAKFADSVRLPELRLFRRALLLVTEHGGRFAPTLERLASVTRDRSILISAARVSTTSMRITANVMLYVVAPFILLTLSAQRDDFWTQLLTHPIANTGAAIGVSLMALGVATLRKMSAFKP